MFTSRTVEMYKAMSKYSLRNILDDELVSKNLTCARVVINALDFFFFPGRFQNMSLKPRLSLEVWWIIVYNGRSQLSPSVLFQPKTKQMELPRHNVKAKKLFSHMFS